MEAIIVILELLLHILFFALAGFVLSVRYAFSRAFRERKRVEWKLSRWRQVGDIALGTFGLLLIVGGAVLWIGSIGPFGPPPEPKEASIEFTFTTEDESGDSTTVRFSTKKPVAEDDESQEK